MEADKPFWEMSRINLDNLGRYDRLYKEQRKKLLTSKNQTRHKKTVNFPTKTNQKTPASRMSVSASRNRPRVDDIGEIELVGYKPSEYRAVRHQEPLRGRTAPSEYGSRDTFKDCHTPIQITKRFQGSPILSVPIRNSPVTVLPTVKKSPKPHPKRDPRFPIFDSLFDESIEPHENIDPWGYAADEKVVCKEMNLNGIKVKVSRL